MEIRLTFLFFFLALTASAQQLPDFGLHRVRIVDSDQTVRAELLPVNRPPKAKPMLRYYWYASNKIHQLQGGYSGELLNGSYTEYYPNKNLKTQGNFKNGLKDGTWKTWFEQGTLSEITTWGNGVMSGPFDVFNASGAPVISGNHRRNLLDGKLLLNQGTDSARTVWYKNGKQVPPKPSLLQKINIFKKRNKPDKAHA